MSQNELFLREAEALKPKLLISTKEAYGSSRALRKGEETLLDLGGHAVGYPILHLKPEGRIPDAPILLSVRFYESSEEFHDKPERYKGWICASWIQEDRIHVDVIPCAQRMNRRYAFRYIKVKVLEAPRGLSVRVEKIVVEAVSSADDSRLRPFAGKEQDRRMDMVAVHTLHECMQEVFEDGPKRDRRLWLGISAPTGFGKLRNLPRFPNGQAVPPPVCRGYTGGRACI